ncbi:2-nitropropane dioxygenase [Beauveria brongniartii RCEF 3172]|uniref:2-nitropropane dioxygenase n=1 Tax=Beauveria brongniartii RCEF 3172 TaxID=1081107 RepID=A0A162MJH7_9HYPO|nr:2-nitropropane dioxygenase [Beauveria brongniartii RCEF 3172]
MAPSKLKEWFPWTTAPVIINGPMIGAASPALASEVSKAGGIGFVSSIVNLEPGSPELTKANDNLAEVRHLLNQPPSGGAVVHAGMSCITGHASVLHFTDTDGADVVVCQGIDAGGHQFRRGMGVVSFVPEVRRMLQEEFPEREVALVAAGGIVNGKGVAAALALGADGVVMGTRFTVADESIYPDFRKAQVLAAKDGGKSTFKYGKRQSPFNDQMNNSALWGPLYDGRALVSEIHDKFLGGATLEECQAALAQVAPAEEAAKLINTWA